VPEELNVCVSAALPAVEVTVTLPEPFVMDMPEPAVSVAAE
jgi:hypothetical protein